MMNPEEQEYLQNMEKELELVRAQNQQFSTNQASTMFQSEDNENLVKWQLDITEELEFFEHLLRGDEIERDNNGNEVWVKPKDEKNQLFNDKGVKEILKVLKTYLNKNLILSHFDEDFIKVRVKQFGNVFSDFIFNNYQDFGLNTPEKQKHYPMMIINIVNSVEASYYRALGGGERNSLRTARTVTQTEYGGGFGSRMMGAPPAIPQRNKFRWLKPTTWFG